MADQELIFTPADIIKFGNLEMIYPHVKSDVVKGKGFTSRWNSAFNDVFIKVIRKDLKVLYTEDDGSGNVRVYIDGGVPAGLSGYLGQIYIRSEDIDGTYNMTGGTAAYIILDADYDVDTAQGWINVLSSDCYLKTEIWQERTIGEETEFPHVEEEYVTNRIDRFDTRGELTIFINPYASRIVKPKEDYNYELAYENAKIDSDLSIFDEYHKLSKKDENMYCVIRPKIEIVNYPEELTALEEDTYEDEWIGFTCTSMQMLNAYGPNMAPYDIGANGSLQHFLGDFKRPRIWMKEVAGRLWSRYPFDMQWLRGEHTHFVNVSHKGIDINGTEVTSWQNHSGNLYYFGVIRSQSFANGALPFVSSSVKMTMEIDAFVYGDGESTYKIRPSLYPIRPKTIMLDVKPFELSGTICNNLSDLVTLLNTELAAAFGTTYTAAASGSDLKIDFAGTGDDFLGTRIPLRIYVDYRPLIAEDFTFDVFGAGVWDRSSTDIQWDGANAVEYIAISGTATFKPDFSSYIPYPFTLTPGRKYRIHYTMTTLLVGFTCQVKVGGNAGSLHTISATSTPFVDEIVCGSGTDIVFEIGTVPGKIELSDMYEKKDGLWKYPDSVSMVGVGSNVRISEIKEIKIDKCDCPNPIYLKWLGPKGWNYWLFNNNQLVNDITTSLGEFEKFFEDLSKQQADTEFLGKEAWEEWQIGTYDLDDDEWKGIETLFNSPQVYMLVNPYTWALDYKTPALTIPPKWLVVKVLPGKTPVKQTKHNQHFFECTLKFPKFNLQWA
jgi:hypothetical protein